MAETEEPRFESGDEACCWPARGKPAVESGCENLEPCARGEIVPSL
jgi:hypothetical protein